MGGKITHCVKSPNSVILHHSHPPSDVPTRKFSIDSNDGLSKHVELSHSHDTAISTNPGGNDARNALEQVFLLCESGILTTIEFIINNHPDVQALLNETHECCIADISMSLTPLQVAAAGGHGDIVMYLLEFAEVSPNAADPMFGFTALHLAVYLNHFAVVETLCKDARVDPLQRNYDGKSSLQLSVERENVSAVEAFFRLRPNLDFTCTDFDGNTILHSLALSPNKQMLQLLLLHINNAILRQQVDQFQDDQVSPSTKQMTWTKLKRQFFVTTNHQGLTATDILFNYLSLLQRKNASIYNKDEQKDEKDELTNPRKAPDVQLDERYFRSPDAQRNKMLSQTTECLRLLRQAIHTSPSMNGLYELDVSPNTTVASQLNVSAVSWSPKNETMFHKINESEDSHLSPLAMYID